MKGSGRKVKIIIAAGGTGGHVFPGVAVACEIKASHPDALVTFAGTARGLEAKVLPKLGWPLVLMKSSSIKDRKGLSRLFSWAKLPISILRGLSIIMKERPNLFISIGGYAAGPLAISAWILRVPLVLVEPNAIAGLTNRILGRFAKKAFVAFDDAKKYFPAGKAVVSGNPVRSEVLSVRERRMPALEKITVFVFGGSQGALALNRAIIGALPFLSDVKNRLSIIHQTGANDDLDAVRNAYKKAEIDAKVFEFSDRIWEYYAGADLVVARSGATTVAELLALAIPAVLVPYPYAADDHQRANAHGMVKTGGAVMIPDGELTGERLSREIKIFVERPELLLAMRAALEKFGKPDAAAKIVKESWKLVETAL